MADVLVPPAPPPTPAPAASGDRANGPPSTSTAGPSRSKAGRPMPGDGAYLMQSQSQSQQGGEVGSAQRGRKGRGRGTNSNAQRNGQRGGADGANGHDAPPHRPYAPVSMHGPTTAMPSEHNPTDTQQGGGSGQRGGRARDRGQRGRGRGGGREGSNSTSTRKTDPSSSLPAAALDPGAPSFQPGHTHSHSHVSAPTSPALNLSGLSHEDPGRTQSERGKPRGKNDRRPKQQQTRSQPKTPDTPVTRDKAAPPAAGGGRSARRAAFEQGAKLTKTISGSSGASGSGSRVTDAKTQKTENKPAGGAGRLGKKAASEADDLIDRLTRGLGKRPFFECPICYNAVTPSQQIWCCLPPDSPPPSSYAPGIDVIDPKIVSSHYQACYTPFHYTCVRDWSKRNLEEETSRLRAIDSDEEPVWRCPGCQKRRAHRIPPYRCFCGRMTHPPTNTLAPHSCGDICSRKRHTCSHSCPLPCHPGPCPPCQVALVVPCPSHNYPLTVKCHMSSSGSTSTTPVCGIDCGRPLACGHKDHTCDSPCHYGPCQTCEVVETVRCYCGRHTKEVACGWNRDHELLSVKMEDGQEEEWKGRYNCGEACDRFFDCGVHPCQETCHPHSIIPLVCPHSPAKITHCPCGATALQDLPGYPRADCLAPVPTCKQRCPKARPCGHTCPMTCHEGPCPPCHEEVVRPCRCGESQLVVGCDELRDRKEQGLGELTCERVCKALRSCGRHECGRLCCPLSFQAKAKGKKRMDGLIADDGLHACTLTCGRTLGCGLHTCPKPDHRGACGRCLQASYDELICHCGKTVVYPPVACGTTINCQYACARPAPACGHPKTVHPCHEQETCPPCPYLTTRACACGKDPAVKHVRCSQDRVSCGQICGTLLPCGFHTCDKTCHRPGECEPCAQVCSKPKRICRHPCTAQCHAPAKCPENDACQYLVIQTCACGNLSSRASCGASINTPSRETTQLKCNSECAIKQRNARLADALGINPTDRPTVDWNTDHKDLRDFAIINVGFVKMVEATFKDFFSGQRQTQILPHMPPSKRTFVMGLADAYHLGRELIDQEPNRSVQIRRRIDTRIPHPLLSAAVAPPTVAGKPALGNLGNLRTAAPAAAPAWGKPKPTTTPSLGTLAKSQALAESGASGSGSASAINTPRHSRPVTPTPPVLEEVKGKVGEVDELDWDED